MKIGKYHLDWLNGNYQVYTKKILNKAGNEYPEDASYFSTLAGALKEVRHLMIATKIGRNKEDDLATIITLIKDVDKYFVDCLEKMPEGSSQIT